MYTELHKVFTTPAVGGVVVVDVFTKLAVDCDDGDNCLKVEEPFPFRGDARLPVTTYLCNTQGRIIKRPPVLLLYNV